MKLIDRFMCGLFKPSEVMSFREDKKSFTFLYFIFLVILFLLPSAILLSLDYGLSFEMRSDIKKGFEESEVIPYVIESDKLVFDDSVASSENNFYTVEINEILVYFTSIDFENEIIGIEIDLEKTQVLFATEGIYLLTPIGISNVLKYNEYSFNGLQFSLAKEKDDVFWTHAFSVLNKITDNYKTEYFLVSYFQLILSSMMSIGLFSVVITFFLRMSVINRISFSKHWQMMIYIMTPYVLGNLLASLFGVLALYYIGMFITILYSFKTGQRPYQGGQNNEF